VDVAVDQPTAGRRDQQRVADVRVLVRLAQAQIAAQRRHGRGVQRQLARFAELALAHGQQRVPQVEVRALQPDRLADAHPGHRQQPDQRAIGRLAQAAAQRGGGGHQRRDLPAGVQIRDRAPRPPRQRVGGRHLMAWVERVQIAGKAAHDREPERPPAAAPGGRQRRPGERVGDRHAVLPERLEMLQVLRQKLLGALELEAERATDPQIVGQLRVERAHAAPPGHGRASSRSRSRSTFA